MKDRIYELCGEANLPKPETFSSFVWFRALGGFKKNIASDLGVSDRTLDRWENKAEENLSIDERAELICLSVRYEYEHRLGGSQ